MHTWLDLIFLYFLTIFPDCQFEFRLPDRTEWHGAGASSHLRGGEEAEVGRHSNQSLQEHGLYHRSYIITIIKLSLGHSKAC